MSPSLPIPTNFPQPLSRTLDPWLVRSSFHKPAVSLQRTDSKAATAEEIPWQQEECKRPTRPAHRPGHFIYHDTRWLAHWPYQSNIQNTKSWLYIFVQLLVVSSEKFNTRFSATYLVSIWLKCLSKNKRLTSFVLVSILFVIWQSSSYVIPRN